jgi:hypothetical protein
MEFISGVNLLGLLQAMCNYDVGPKAWVTDMRA